ncbi:hypothetical protein FSARC_9543 [Fusarium sarcochroum]|uniref:Heterokaryon incompatibility domain-containing protein n=1 Tax=Fusarium sarcochroum TaxID=1208366 RepID=A0A8H4TQW9_9HYPO|nr:hypothetical protein FSARC_9543 [Fusarium sarcochroum]
MTSSFKYWPLLDNEIRVLKIEDVEIATNKSKRHPIACSLEHVCLPSALSHVPNQQFKGDGRTWPELHTVPDTEALFKNGQDPHVEEANSVNHAAIIEKDADLPWRYEWGDFIALSYVWGSADRSDFSPSITVNGFPFKVTPNLYSALLQLSQSRRIRQGFKLWVDAICINQADQDERGRQVARMRDIYQSAWQVAIWLGPEDKDSSLALSALSWLTRESERPRPMEEFYHEGFSLDLRPVFIIWPTYHSPMKKEVYRALFHFFTRPYWRRMWVVQEVAMGNPNTPVLCGDKGIAWNDVYQAVKVIASDEARFGRAILESVRPRILSTWSFELARDRLVQERKWAPERMWKVQETMMRIQQDQRVPGASNNWQDLVRALSLARDSLLTNEKDRVYGILGIKAIADRVHIEPNYNLPISTIYANFTSELVSTGDLNILRLASRHGGDIPTSWVIENLPSPFKHHLIAPLLLPFLDSVSKSRQATSVGTACDHKLPSWTICWSCSPAPTAQLRGDYQADRSLRFLSPTSVVSNSVLRTKGIVLDTIISLSAFHVDEIDEGYPQNTSSTSSIYGDANATRTALWRTIVGDTMAGSNDPAPESYSWLLDHRLWQLGIAGVHTNGFGLQDFMFRNKKLELCGFNLEQLVNGPEGGKRRPEARYYNPNNEQREAFSCAVNTLAWRRLFGTGSGRMGLGTCAIEVGDNIVVVKGCNTPLVLRRSGGGWKLIGECYTLGVILQVGGFLPDAPTPEPRQSCNLKAEMDPLSAIGSIISVIQAISSAYKAIQHLRGLPHEFDEVARNLPLARDTLGLARDHLQGLALDEPSKNALQPVISKCEEKAKMLQDIFEKVEEGTRNARNRSVLDFYRTSLLRLGKAHRVESLMGGILKDLDALSTNRLFATVTQSQLAQLKDAIDELSHVRSSVSDSEFEGPVSNIMNNNDNATGYMSIISGQSHVINPGSGKFFNAQNMTFETKIESQGRVGGSMLWVSANPGCGKSVLAKYLVDSELPTTNSRTTCYFFFKDDFEDQRTATGALSCILHQLFTQREVLFSDKIIKRFENHRTHVTSSFDELWEVLVMASKDSNAGELVCILDAFDECEDQQRGKFVKALQKFYGADSGAKHDVNLKLLITSRPYDKIRLDFQPVVHLEGESEEEIAKIAREVDAYIDFRVSCIRESLPLNLDEAALLLRELRRVPNQTYLWVYLTLDLIENDISIDRTKIQEATSSLPQTVDDAYERILARSSKPKEAKKLLHIIVAAARPLTLAEMDIALALRKTHKSYKDLEARPEVRFRKYVTDLCGLFITITNSKIYLLHQTAKEFLVPKYESNFKGRHDHQLTWKHSLPPPESHHVLFGICIQLLHFTELETPSVNALVDETGSISLRDHLLLDYSALNWAAHFRGSHVIDDAVIDSVRQICDTSSRRYSNWFQIHWTRTRGDSLPPFTTLMITAYLGLGPIVKLHLDAGNVEVNSTDGTYGRSALSWASENGFDNVVELLINGPRFHLRNINKWSFLTSAKINAKDKHGRTPLSYAAWNGHLIIVNRLVRAGARVDSQDNIGGTPISYALISGQEAVFYRLVKGAQIESVDTIRRKLLISAAQTGYAAVVERLLENGADKEIMDSTGHIALYRATVGGHVEVVRLLVDKGADVNRNQRVGFTALGHAIDNRSTDMMTILLKRGARVHDTFISITNVPGFHYSTSLRTDDTPLIDPDVDKQDIDAVELLLDYGARPDFNKETHVTPLSLARSMDDKAIVQILESRLQ